MQPSYPVRTASHCSLACSMLCHPQGTEKIMNIARNPMP